MKKVYSLAFRNWPLAAWSVAGASLRGLVVVLSILILASSGSAQGLPVKTCGTVQAYLCLDNIVAVDGSGYNGSGYPSGIKVGGLYLIDPSSGNQTPISTGGYLGQAASVALEPGTGKILAATRTYGVIRVDPKDGSQEVLLKGGTGWGTGFPTFSDSANNNATESFIYPGGITIDPVDSSILVTDTGIRLNACTDPNNVTTCASDPGKIIRIKKGQGAGVYAGTAVVAKGGSLSDPFDIAVDGGRNIYVTDMNAKLGGASDPGVGGIIYLNALQNYQQSTFFSSYQTNTVSTTGCPMGITITPSGTVMATVFSYNGFGCAPQAIFSLTPDPWGINLPTYAPIFNGYPLQFPFGMDPDLEGRIIIADEGSGYGCAGTIFRLDLTKPIVTSYTGNLLDFNPFALSPYVGQGCIPANQTYLSTPADVAVVKVVVTANIATTPPSSVTVNMSPAAINEGGTATLSGSFVDGSDTHTVTINWGDGSPNTVLSLAAEVVTIPATPHQYLDNLASSAPYTVNVTVADASASASGSTTVTVNNASPAVTGVSGPSGPLALGTAASIGVNFTDAGSQDTHTCTFSWGDGQPNTTLTAAGIGNGTCTANHTYSGSGSFTVGVTVTDKDGGSATDSSFKVTVNTAPAISSLGATPSVINENGTTSLAGAFTDPNASDTHVVTINWGDGSSAAINLGAGVLSFSASHQYLDDNPTVTPSDVYTVSVAVADNLGASTSGNTSVTVNNVDPVIPAGGVTGPTVPLVIGSAATVVANFTDVGTKDTHTCTFDWDDTTTTTVSGTPGVTETNGSGSCKATRTFAGPGVYNVGVTVTDDDGGSAMARIFQYVVIYDPAEGSVNGSGWIDSLPGAYLPNPALVGTAKFGFQSKYEKGKTVPTGNTNFNFKAAKFKFKSTVYQWLVISGARAQYKGSGVVKVHDTSHAGDDDCENESHWRQWTGNYAFVLTAEDGGLSDGTDKFRIKITDNATNSVIYDNKRGESDDMDAANPQIIAGGRITIKKQ